MDAIQMLIDEHKEAEELFAMFERADNEAVEEAVVLKLCRALKAHMMIEEEIFYPEAKEILEEDDLVEEAVTEHKLARKIMQSLEKREPGVAMSAHVLALKKAIEHHVHEEETELFPKLQAEGMDTTELGARMHARKLEILKQL